MPGDGVQEFGGCGGVFLLDKPIGMSSFALVRRVRRLLGMKKVGHAGTLDPFASGLLIVCAGREATRTISCLQAGRKRYEARLQLGVETDTLDPEGAITRTRPVHVLHPARIEACLRQYLGPQMQTPPAYSAAKHRGKPLYFYARRGLTIEKEPKPIEIYALRLQHYNPATYQLDVEIECGRGAYVRVLAAAIGEGLGCGAHAIALRRTASGEFEVANAVDGQTLFSSDGLAALLQARYTAQTSALGQKRIEQ